MYVYRVSCMCRVKLIMKWFFFGLVVIFSMFNFNVDFSVGKIFKLNVKGYLWEMVLCLWFIFFEKVLEWGRKLIMW